MFALYIKHALTLHLTSEWLVSHLDVRLHVRLLGGSLWCSQHFFLDECIYLSRSFPHALIHRDLYDHPHLRMKKDNSLRNENKHAQLRTLYHRMADKNNKVKIQFDPKNHCYRWNLILTIKIDNL